jgi:HD-like signal output (HDOD) protein
VTNPSDPGAGGPEELLEKLRKALARDGDFPASAKVVNELRMLTSDPKTTANQITELILAEPSLGIRVLQLVNSSFYQRARPIMTVSQAVIQLGMKPIAELCANLVLLQKFVPAAREGGAFATCLKKSMLTSLLSSSFGEKTRPSSDTKNRESGFLAGSLAELGTLLLAFYFPTIYENALKRAQTKDVDIGRSIQEITGVTPTELSVEVIKAVGLPPFFAKVVEAVNEPKIEDPTGVSQEQKDLVRTARNVFAAQELSDVLVTGAERAELDAAVEEIVKRAGIDPTIVGNVLGELPGQFLGHCGSLDLKLPPIPDFVASYEAPAGLEAPAGAAGTRRTTTIVRPGAAARAAAAAAGGQVPPPGANAPLRELAPSDPLMEFISEIKDSVSNKEPTTSVITSVMESLAWNMQFDRVLLLVVTPTKKHLLGRMMLGKSEGINPAEIKRSLGPDAPEKSSDVQAFRLGKLLVQTGDPVLPDSKAFAVLPIGVGDRSIGVIYVDRSTGTIDPREQTALQKFTDLLDESIVNQR